MTPPERRAEFELVQDRLSDRQAVGAELPAPALALPVPEFVAMVAGLMALNALAIDVMLPALDDIAASFALTEANDQQLVVFAYVLGFGAPQLVFGPLTDRFGRRPVLFGALAAYAALGFACMLARSFDVLLALRFLQGVAASGCRVVSVSTVRDVFEGRGMARIMSLVMTIFMVVPIAAPSIGQLILLVLPWSWTFGVLGVAGLGMLVWSYVRLPETLPPARRRPLNPSATAADYAAVFRCRVTFGYLSASGVIFGALFAFIGSAEQLFTEVFDLGDAFVLWFAGVAFSMSMATFANSRLVERLGMRRLSHGALLAFTGFSILLAVLMATAGEHFAVFFPLFCIVFACFGLIGSNFNALAMEPLGELAGTASAAYGFSVTTVSSLIGYLIGRQYDGSSVPVIMGFAALGLASLAIVLVVERGRLFASR